MPHWFRVLHIYTRVVAWLIDIVKIFDGRVAGLIVPGLSVLVLNVYPGSTTRVPKLTLEHQ